MRYPSIRFRIWSTPFKEGVMKKLFLASALCGVMLSASAVSAESSDVRCIATPKPDDSFVLVSCFPSGKDEVRKGWAWFSRRFVPTVSDHGLPNFENLPRFLEEMRMMASLRFQIMREMR
jgi:hypothetical protein